MRRHRLCVFEPVERNSFTVYDGKEPRKTKQKRKRWSEYVKMNAVRKYHQFGLTKAIRILHEENPEQYADLTPSTLQYWVQILSRDALASLSFNSCNSSFSN